MQVIWHSLSEEQQESYVDECVWHGTPVDHWWRTRRALALREQIEDNVVAFEPVGQ